MWGGFISRASEGPQLFRFFQKLRLLPMPSLAKIEQERSSRSKEKDKNYITQKLSTFAKMNIIWPLTPTFELCRSKSNSFANLQSLMANDGSLKSCDQAEFVLGLLAGVRNNYRNKLLCSPGQTDSSKCISWKIWSPWAFSFLGNNSAQISNAHFPIQINFSALCVGSLTFFGLKRTAKCQAPYRTLFLWR